MVGNGRRTAKLLYMWPACACAPMHNPTIYNAYSYYYDHDGSDNDDEACWCTEAEGWQVCRIKRIRYRYRKVII